MTAPVQNPISLRLLQAVSDWQRGGNPKQKQSRGERLKEAAASLDPKYRSCNLCAFRQIALEDKSLWELLAENRLSETISAWTTDLGIAKAFKGGVPPQGQGYQGVIFMLPPGAGTVIVNLSTLFADEAFRGALNQHRIEICGFGAGIGRYGPSQSEVVIELDSLELAQVYAFGGFSSSRVEIARTVLGHAPSPYELALFNERATRAGATFGPYWINGQSVQRVVQRMQPHIERLRPVKRLQDANRKWRRP
jgi:hypothetical protein